jgi:hypothetical protein
MTISHTSGDTLWLNSSSQSLTPSPLTHITEYRHTPKYLTYKMPIRAMRGDVQNTIHACLRNLPTHFLLSAMKHDTDSHACGESYRQLVGTRPVPYCKSVINLQYYRTEAQGALLVKQQLAACFQRGNCALWNAT